MGRSYIATLIGQSWCSSEIILTSFLHHHYVGQNSAILYMMPHMISGYYLWLTCCAIALTSSHFNVFIIIYLLINLVFLSSLLGTSYKNTYFIAPQFLVKWQLPPPPNYFWWNDNSCVHVPYGSIILFVVHHTIPFDIRFFFFKTSCIMK